MAAENIVNMSDNEVDLFFLSGEDVWMFDIVHPSSPCPVPTPPNPDEIPDITISEEENITVSDEEMLCCCEENDYVEGNEDCPEEVDVTNYDADDEDGESDDDDNGGSNDENNEDMMQEMTATDEELFLIEL